MLSPRVLVRRFVMLWLLPVLAVVLAMPALAQADAAGERRPNFVIVIADDATFSDLPLYGGQNVQTPYLDQLASQGMTFNRAYLGMSMCSPCRAELYTGLYPQNNGVCWNHGVAKAGTKSFTHHLEPLGYRTGLAGKRHTNPRDVFPYEYVRGLEQNCVKDSAEFDGEGIAEFISRDPDQPFMLVVALVVPHVVWTAGDYTAFDQSKFKLPPHMADTAQTREDFAKYLAEIQVMDEQIGMTMQILEEAGVAEDTVLIFTSEQGAQIPGCKWTNYDAGVHTAMVVRWPGKVEAGVRTDAMVQYTDVLPTLVDAAGGEAEPGVFDGTSFLGVLTGEADTHRDYTYALHNNVPEGPPYPIRAVCDGQFRYIRNLSPDSLYIQRFIMGKAEHNPYWNTWMFESQFNERAAELINRIMIHPAEELYDLAADPSEMNNLAADPACASHKQRLSAELDRWMESVNDTGAAMDTVEAYRANKNGGR